jgi:hypothetical protein
MGNAEWAASLINFRSFVRSHRICLMDHATIEGFFSGNETLENIIHLILHPRCTPLTKIADIASKYFHPTLEALRTRIFLSSLLPDQVNFQTR